MKARIYKPSKSAMQSGFARMGQWVLECEPSSARTPESLMGWVSSGDTQAQIRLKFENLEDAQNYAQDHGIEYTVSAPRSRKIRPRNYSDNFRYVPPGDQKA